MFDFSVITCFKEDADHLWHVEHSLRQLESVLSLVAKIFTTFVGMRKYNEGCKMSRFYC